MRTILLRTPFLLWSVVLAASCLTNSGSIAAPPATVTDQPSEAGSPQPADVVSGMIEHARANPSGEAAYSFDASAFRGDMRDLPIGVFDSGIGGLTVLEAILGLDAFDNETLRPGPDGRKDFEQERFVYLGDQANMPYGNYAASGKEDYLRELILKDVSFLLGRRYFPSPTAPQPAFDKPPVKAIVIACNTATAYGLNDIRQALAAWQLPVIVVGVVEAGAAEVAATPGSPRPAPSVERPGTVAVLATVGTCSSMAYPKAIGRALGLAGKRVPKIVQQGSVGLAQAIEENPAAAEQHIHDDVLTLLKNYRREGGEEPISTVVLGCTHFPLVQEQIAESFEHFRSSAASDGKPYGSLIAEEIRWIDPAELTAKALFRELAKSRLRRTADDTTAAAKDLLFLSVPNRDWPGIRLDRSGGLAHDYKYGREVGQLSAESTHYVPMTLDRLPESSLKLIRNRLPEVWKRLQ